MNPTPQPQHHTETPCLYSDDLKALLDGELSFWHAWRVRLHARRCPQCREEMAMIQTITEELHQEIQTSEAPASLAPELRAQILDAARQTAPASVPAFEPVPDSPRAPNTRRLTLRLAPWLALVPLAACLVIIVMSLTGGKIKNTFNTASSAITTTDGGDIWSGFGGSSSSAQSPAQDVAPPGTGMSTSPGDNVKRRVHKEGSLSVAVKDVEKSSDEVMRLVRNVGGFIASNSLSTTNGRTAQLETRVPIDKFELVVNKIGILGQVRAKNISGEDITDRYVTSLARRDAMQRELAVSQAQLNALLAKASRSNRADQRQLQDQVADMRARFAAAQAQFLAVRHLTALASLSVTLQEKTAPQPAASLSQDLGKTGREAWGSFLTTVRLPLFFLIYVLAYSPIWLPAILLWRRYAPPPRR